MRSPFDVLGVDPGADDEAIERAYRRRVKETHPDQGGSAPAFLRVRAAYQALEAADTAGPGAPDEAGPAPGGASVEYLDYDVLVEQGWDLADEDLFERADAAGLGPPARGCLEVDPDESLLAAAEAAGFDWPYACRGGACANCAVAVRTGDVSTPVDHVLPRDMTDRGIRLSCVGRPTTAEARVVFNVKHLPALDELRLPPHPFERARSD